MLIRQGGKVGMWGSRKGAWSKQSFVLPTAGKDRAEAELAEQLVLAAVHAGKAARRVVVVPGQVQHAVDDVERQFRPRGREVVTVAPVSDRWTGGVLTGLKADTARPARHAHGDIGADDDLAINDAPPAAGAEVERQHIRRANNPEETLMKPGHGTRTEDNDRKVPRIEALRNERVTGDPPEQTEDGRGRPQRASRGGHSPPYAPSGVDP
jgi:hypothetical protein